MAHSIVIPTIFGQFSELASGQSTRHGGVSEPPFQWLNLGAFVNDNPNHVAQNRAIFFENIGLSPSHVASSFQTHSDLVLEVQQPGEYTGYDALITNKTGIALAISVADCVPILLYDPQTKAIGAAHAGWKGTVAQIVVKTLQAMKLVYNTQPEHCFAYIGTCISVKNFEVSADVAQCFQDSEKVWNQHSQKFHVDLKQANKNQLLGAGLLEQNIEVSAYCTVQNNDTFFSHRAEKGTTGRMFATIVRKV
jgi:polyphenol oxidase